MCIPHAPNKSFSAEHKERKKPKKHIEFDKKRMEPDPDFVDERTKPYEKQSEAGLFDRIKSFFDER